MEAMHPAEHLAALLRDELGEGMVVAAPSGALAIGGREPELLLAPTSAAEVGQAVAAAARVGLAVAPLGGGTAIAALGPPHRPYAGLLTQRLTGVVEHAADDLTVTVRAGTTAAELASVLAAARQRLPVDVPLAERATVGGMIATAASGPLRLGHGTLRDYLLGITVAGADGRVSRAGGRVVKNVAGYDLMKMHTGAHGTLGVVVEATFKVKPIAERFAWVIAAVPTPAMAEAVRRSLAAAQVPAAALELLSLGLAAEIPALQESPSDPWILAVGIEGVESEVQWQMDLVREVLSAAGAKKSVTVGDPESRRFLRRIVDFGGAAGAAGAAGAILANGGANGDALLVRGAVLPSRLPELIESWQALVPGAIWAVSAGSGVARLRTTVPTTAPTSAMVTALRQTASAAGGHAVVEAMAVSLRDRVDAWGVAAHPLAARLKAVLDPGSVFLPGSYLGLGGLAAASAPAAATAVPR
jgi:glycolate oxidase FAD binding subunit